MAPERRGIRVARETTSLSPLVPAYDWTTQSFARSELACAGGSAALAIAASVKLSWVPRVL